MRGVRVPMGFVFAALALAGCMQTTSPMASASRSDLDALAYGEPQPASYSAAPRASFANSPRNAYTAPTPVAYAAPGGAFHDAPYRLDAGDKLRVVVYGQEGLTNTYAIDAGGAITMPLIGAVQARGKTPAGLAADISAKLRNGYIREPSVAVEVETYRPFFILGEVAAPGQYPYVPNMSVESAVAIAGGFTPRAKRDSVTLTHSASRTVVPLGTPISPGDTILVGERWF
ncbi:MAG: polysaccharide export protein [Bradyrhizobium sp.]|nr:polysaccharide export protein [Bradyrhizobium sp.]